MTETSMERAATGWRSEGDWIYAYRDGVCYAEVNVAVAADVDGLASEMASRLNRAVCSCCEEAQNMIKHGRTMVYMACTCPDHPPEDRCDCPFCHLARHRQSVRTGSP